MQRNSQHLGSIFDAQPSELQGNIHSISDPSEVVTGYVSISPIQEKRIFIPNSALPDWNYQSNFPIQVEQNDTAFIRANNYGMDGTPIPLPVEMITRSPHPQPGGSILTFSAAAVRCVDGTAVGTQSKPAFWP